MFLANINKMQKCPGVNLTGGILHLIEEFVEVSILRPFTRTRRSAGPRWLIYPSVSTCSLALYLGSKPSEPLYIHTYSIYQLQVTSATTYIQTYQLYQRDHQLGVSPCLLIGYQYILSHQLEVHTYNYFHICWK